MEEGSKKHSRVDSQMCFWFCCMSGSVSCLLSSYPSGGVSPIMRYCDGFTLVMIRNQQRQGSLHHRCTTSQEKPDLSGRFTKMVELKGNAEQAKRIGNTGNSAVTLGFSWMSSSSSFAFPRMEEEDNTISTTIRKSS